MITRAADTPLPDVRRLSDERVLLGMLRDVLEHCDPSAIGEARVERCWPRGRGFAFQWSFRFAKQGRFTIAGVPLDRLERSKSAPLGPPRFTMHGLRGLRCSVPEFGLLVFSPDCDPDLPQLADCLDEGKMAHELAPLAARVLGVEETRQFGCRCRLLGYKPARRAALQYTLTGPDGSAVKLAAKTFRKQAGQHLVALHRGLNEQLSVRSACRVRVAEPVGYIESRDLTLFRWGDGEGPSDSEPLGAATIAAAVEGLAALHALSADRLPAFTAVDECKVVSRWLDAAAYVVSASSRSYVVSASSRSCWGVAAIDDVRRELDQLHRMAESLQDRPRCTIHGDYYEKQLIWNERRITLLDLDTLALGDPCRDLGNLLAHVRLSCLKSRSADSTAESLASAAVTHYQRLCGPVDRAALKLYYATALMRVGAVHALRTLGRRFTASMWNAALFSLSSADSVADRVHERSRSTVSPARAASQRESS